ncbi:ABC transporter permease [Yinghuangia sp. ASG 101]|uniref:ABC transporter permease n=1 Tax=Yinghuangia sp. ASG 101 TaxID=2896848 RepID=UPI001E44B731|nr:ABC transporter permease [Yinghuangia sp. ASG 101]UGQ13735.1 ABC transporter permease [Yinghuangia sp. ASG 101]
MTTATKPTAPAMTATPEKHDPHPQVPDSPKPFAIVRHSLTLTWRNLVKLKHQPEQLIDLTLQPILFIVMFVYLFGGAIEGSTKDYLQFVLPGILVQTVVFASLGTGVALCEDISKGVFDRFRSLPISRFTPLAGAALGDVCRYVVSIAIVFGFGSAIGFRVQTDVFSALAAVGLVLVFAFAMSWIFVVLGVTMKNPRSVQGTAMLIGFPLTFGANIFARTETMPGWLQAWVDVNPVSHLTSAVRALLVDDGSVGGHAIATLLWAAAIFAVFAPLAVNRYANKT